MEQEQRLNEGKNLLAKSLEGDGILTGYAMKFNETADIGGMFYEKIERGAITAETISDVSLFVNHDRTKIPLARFRQDNSQSTMKLNIDNVGLEIKAKLDVENNIDARALYSAVQRGDIKGMSFAFTVEDEKWINLNSDMPTRIIKKIKKITEVSAVTEPAYSGTSIMARNEIKNQLEAVRIKEKIKLEVRENMNSQKEVPEIEKLEKDKILLQREKAGIQFREKNRIDKVRNPLNIFGELRTLTVTPADGEPYAIAVPTYEGDKVNSDFSSVSSIIDAVSHLQLKGGESFKTPYAVGNSIGGYTDEEEVAFGVDTEFKFVDIRKAKITAYIETSEEVTKLSNVAYADYIFQYLRDSVRQLIAKEIMYGVGLKNNSKERITGIFSDRATAIDSDTDIAFATIDDTTLERIISKYGGNETVDNNSAVLILNQRDLMAFESVRTSTTQKYYNISYNGNGGGNINGVPFIINSACKALSSSETAEGEYCMAYGNPKNYQFVEFSPMEVKRSEDYKFPYGITAFKARVFCGGNVVKHNGFLRIKKF